MKIAVMGSAPSSVQQGPFIDKSFEKFGQGKPVPKYPPSPFADDTWDIWGCSPGLFGGVPRASRWFELHRYEPGKTWFSPEYCQWLTEFRGPVYVGGPTPFKNQVRYPIKRVEEEFSAFFLTSSLAQMQALAILTIEDLRTLRRNAKAEVEQPQCNAANEWLRAMGMAQEQIDAEMLKDDADDVIGLWGVDMSATEEYLRQRPGCWFFALQTMERGIGLYYPPESDLMVPEPIYGLCEWDHEYIKATSRMHELSGRRNNCMQQHAATAQEGQMLAGAIDGLNYQIRNWMGKEYALPAGVVLRRPKVR